ncbi:MAG TPA: class I SAM-dependent methyltransferase [Humisphaera sp.]|jgi:hypothetical protein|nr:class I SAM-dependent methyltransferase [Humisphaera sp.]
MDKPCRSDQESTSIRARYEREGSQGFYERHGASYRNPHEPIIVKSLDVACRKWTLDLSNVLDLAAGSGEVTLAIRALGAKKVHGVDPYTWAAYESRTGQPAAQLSFADIAGGALNRARYSLIVASFALHLCEKSRLPALMYELSRISPRLLVLTPHKRPEIRRDWGWELVEEQIVERVRSRLYRAVQAD